MKECIINIFAKNNLRRIKKHLEKEVIKTYKISSDENVFDDEMAYNLGKYDLCRDLLVEFFDYSVCDFAKLWKDEENAECL